MTARKTIKTKQFNCRLPIPLIERIEGKSKSERRTKTEIFVKALEKYLGHGRRTR